jgi:hypothetical protein
VYIALQEIKGIKIVGLVNTMAHLEENNVKLADGKQHQEGRGSTSVSYIHMWKMNRQLLKVRPVDIIMNRGTY